jgi:ABC-type transport system substrate-binding protein
LERAVYNDLGAKFQFGMLMSSSGFANLDPAALPQLSRYWDINNNLAGMNANEQYKQLVTSASTEPDPAKRKAILGSLNDLILDESFTIPVATAKHLTLVRSNVNGFRFQPGIESANYTDTWIA